MRFGKPLTRTKRKKELRSPRNFVEKYDPCCFSKETLKNGCRNFESENISIEGSDKGFLNSAQCDFELSLRV